MTERAGRRSSKWDLKDGPDNFATEIRQDNASFGKASESIHDNGSIQSKNTGSRNSKWSDSNPNNVLIPEGNSRCSRWEPASGNRAEVKDDSENRDFHEVPQNVKAWDSNRSYSTSMSPGLNERRPPSHSRSPKRGWSKLHRSRSRSPARRLRSRSRTPPHRPRSRSRSPPHGLRSRTRTPPHGIKRDSEGWNDRIRSESRVPVCNDFARGRCKRGSQCRFSHQVNIGNEGRRNSGSDSIENWGNRHEGGGSYGHPNNVERDYSRDEIFHGNDSQRNNRSSERCLNFLKGSCHRGSSCRFIHESPTDDGRGASERTHERDTRPYPGHEHRREPYRNNSTPCKYFAMGSCRNGINCRFSHEGAVHGRPEGRPGDDRRGHNLGDENKSREGPKWRDEATDSAQGGAEGRPLNYGSSRIAGKWGDQSSGRPETSVGDERRGHNLDDQNKPWRVPKWGDETAGIANGSIEGTSVSDGRSCIADSSWGGPKWDIEAVGRGDGIVEGKQVNEGSGHLANSGWGVPKWGGEVADRPEARCADEIRIHNVVDENKSREGQAAVPTDVSAEGSSLNDGRGCDEATDSEAKKGPQWGNDDNSGQLGVSDENKSLGDAKWSGSGAEPEVTKTSSWRNDINEIDAKSGIAGSRPWGVPTWTDKPCADHVVHRSPRWASMGVDEEMVNSKNTPGGIGRETTSQLGITLSHEHTSSEEVSVEQHYPTAGMHPHPASTFMMRPATVPSMKAQPLAGPRVEKFDLNGPVEAAGPQMSPIITTSAAPLTQNTVTSEQVAKISNLSASLAQIFGNSQQLPQLFATLNSTNPIGFVPPVHQPNQTTSWSSQKQQYDPPLNSSVVESSPVKHSVSQTPMQASFAPSAAGDPAKKGSLDTTTIHHRQSNESRQAEQIPCHSGDTNADEEEGRKSKDTKGVRIFKFALVEFVKEILKPTWKEGQLSKEAHKTVVKKVVDKVTGSVQGDHIPQTQEKIDQYLAYSKNKLTKLVEAYVEKYVKS